MNKRLRVNSTAESGFTLIELIVVIVILGILAATALPKFASLGGDARAATLQAAKGSINTVAALAHGKYLLNGGTTVTLENVTVNLTTGYPTADTKLTDAAGLTVGGVGTDYVVYTATPTGNDTGPTVNTGELVVIPASLKGKAAAANCYVRYAQVGTGSPATVVPTVTFTGSAAACE